MCQHKSLFLNLYENLLVTKKYTKIRFLYVNYLLRNCGTDFNRTHIANLIKKI